MQSRPLSLATGLFAPTAPPEPGSVIDGLPAPDDGSMTVPPDDAPPTPPPPTPEFAQTSLVLTDELEKAAKQTLRERIDHCRKEMGLDHSLTRGITVAGNGHNGLGNESIFNTTRDSWAGKRDRHQAFYDGDLAWRKTHYGAGSIFQESNHTLNIPSRFARLMAAQLDADQLSTDPWCAVMPQQSVQALQGTNATLAKAIEAYIQAEFERSNFKDVLAEGRQAALIRNDATFKVNWTRRFSGFTGTATVLVNALAVALPGVVEPDGSPAVRQLPGPRLPMSDGTFIAPGAPFVLPDGRHIYQDDDVLPDPMGGPDRLLKYPQFQMPPEEQRVFQTIPNLKQVSVDYEGLEIKTMFFKDYLFDIRAATLRESDIHVHVYDDTFSSLRRKYGQFASFAKYDKWKTSEASRARPTQGEREYASTRECAGIHETYILADLDGDGDDEWYLVVYDYQADAIIFIDYLLNHMKEPPFVMIPGVEKVEGRPYGVGVYQKLADNALFVDLQINRINFKAGKGASFTIADPAAIQECKDGLKLVLGSDHIYHFTDDGAQKYGANGMPVRRVNLAELTDQEWKILENAVSFGALEMGLSTDADSSVSNLNPSKTATGIVSNERSGNALQGKTGDLHASRFVDVCNMAMDILLENMPPRVVYSLDGGQALQTLSRDDIRSINRDVRLLLTKARSTESLQRNAQASALVIEYLGLPKAQQKVVNRFFVEQLRALDVQDADELLPLPTDADIAAEQQAAGQGQEKPPTATVAAKLGDFVGSERPQIVAKFFEINPASPGEIQQAAVNAAQEQQVKVPAHHLHPLPPAPTPGT